MRKVSSPRGYKILLDIVPRAEPLKLVGCRSSFAIAGEQVSPHIAAEYLKSLWDLRRAANQPGGCRRPTVPMLEARPLGQTLGAAAVITLVFLAD
jgi:hypothetical protein